MHGTGFLPHSRPLPFRLGLYNVRILKIMTHSRHFWEVESCSRPVQGPNAYTCIMPKAQISYA